MILGLVDRRRAPAVEAREALRAPWDLLVRLAAAVGPAHWCVEAVLVDDAAMAELNLAYRGVEGPTDVLSFSYLAAEGEGRPVLAAGCSGARCDLWLDPQEAAGASVLTGHAAGSPLAGEVVLAPAFITGRCLDRGWAPDREMALLVVHGCLHILGWEHDEDADRRGMMALETAFLRECGLPHPLAEGI